jgi:hypothetical protein
LTPRRGDNLAPPKNWQSTDFDDIFTVACRVRTSAWQALDKVFAMIVRPTRPISHPDRVRDCEDALEEDDFALLERGRQTSHEDFQALAKRAQAAGWMPEEIAAALVSLAQKYVQTARSDAIIHEPLPGVRPEGPA